jgi:Domain of unknown function (DUF4293)
MIQRIQTLYLLSALISLLFIGIFPVLTISNPVISNGSTTQPAQKLSNEWSFTEEVYAMKQLHTVISSSHPKSSKSSSIEVYYINIGILCILAISLISCISFFKNRLLQIRLCWISILLLLVLTTLIYFNIRSLGNFDQNRSLGIGAYSLSASMLFILLARKQIEKDENLVKSVDRLR